MLYLFGSYLEGTNGPESDVDIIIDGDEPEYESIVEELEPYALENGGRLDLFFPSGDWLVAVYSDDDRMVSIRDVLWGSKPKEITLESLLSILIPPTEGRG